MPAARMIQLEHAFGMALKGIAIAALGLLFVMVALIVVSRFVPGLPSAGWTDELIEMLFAWLIFAGSASLWRERGHFAVDLFGQFLPAAGLARRSQEILVELLCLAFLAVFEWQAWVFIVNNATEMSPIFTLPKYYWYGVMPLAGAVMIAYSIARLARLALARPQDPPRVA
jgi:TRAP-type C4-dicarboxylate transport system permease small subunit